MGSRKFTADKIFTGEKFVAGQVLVVDEHGGIEALIPIGEAGDEIQKVEGILAPGFVNCHCHLELSHLKGVIAPHTGLANFVWDVVSRRQVDSARIGEAIEKAENQMIAKGIVAVGDICNNGDTLVQKRKGLMAYYNFIEASGWLPEGAGSRFERARQLEQAFLMDTAPGPCAIVPHAPYSVSPALWDLLEPGFRDRVISIHNQETRDEDELFLHGRGGFRQLYRKMDLDDSFFVTPGCSSVRYYFTKLLGAKNILLVHNTFTGREDLQFIRQHTRHPSNRTWFCLCIKANLYIENTTPPVDLLLENDCSMVVGTDSLASNDTLDILSELKMIQSHFPHLGSERLLQWATRNGAEALGMQATLGSFETGKKPGVNQISVAGDGRLADAEITRII